MSDELRLPDDLAACEAQLAALTLTATGIDRDQLMFRAGWAACEARLSNRAAGVEHMPRRNRTLIAAWSLTSAATAAALAVALALQWRPRAELEMAADEADAPVQVVTDAARSNPLSLAQREVRPAALSELPPGAGIGLLSLRRQALNSAWEQPTNVVTANGGGPPAAKTARQLMREMLPSEPTRSTPLWPWVSTPRGESI
jgi:hypothetical protein